VAIAERHELNTRPPLLVALNEHLKAFTRGRYQVRVANTGGGQQRFIAVDETEQTRELTELSDGTRAQLLLAARLAFLTSAESGPQVPLFLDEALTASDPKRFAAITRALGRMVADTGRQVFYLTSNPGDVAAWQDALREANLPAAHEIDLARLRGEQSAAPRSGLQPARTTPIPVPGTADAATYGQKLMVPPLRPWDHENGVHLFHLLRDDVHLLYQLMVAGAGSLGLWDNVRSDLLRSGVVDQTTADHIDQRAAIWRAFVAAWRVGRGRPVTPENLSRSDILSPTMLPHVLDLLQKVGGDGQALLDAIEIGAIKRFRQNTKKQLAEHLAAGGHLDPRPVSPTDELVARVLGAVGTPPSQSGLNPAAVGELVRGWADVAQSPNP